MITETDTIIIPSSPDDKKAIKNAIVEMSNSLTRIEAEREFLKSVGVRMKEEFDIKPAVINKMAKLYYKASFEEEQMKQSDFEAFYETIMIMNQNQDISTNVED